MEKNPHGGLWSLWTRSVLLCSTPLRLALSLLEYCLPLVPWFKKELWYGESSRRGPRLCWTLSVTCSVEWHAGTFSSIRQTPNKTKKQEIEVRQILARMRTFLQSNSHWNNMGHDSYCGKLFWPRFLFFVLFLFCFSSRACILQNQAFPKGSLLSFVMMCPFWH